ncbi:MAG: ATPase [Hyphomicrobiaceae bacterium]|nr:ATPase [Hyphomicrobiaceae bacterium]
MTAGDQRNGGTPRKVPGREDLKRPLPKRFYSRAQVVRQDGLHALALDGRLARTPGKALLAVAPEPLAVAIAAEWAAQGDVIDPETMPLTRITNTAIDGVTGIEADVAADIVAFAASDLVCYRAETPPELTRRQAAAWDPVLDWAARRLGAHFVLASGVMPVVQPADALERVASHIGAACALELSALHVMTTLTGSALIALAHADAALDVADAWRRAHVDEDWQIERWGADEEAAARREMRWRDMQAASCIAVQMRAHRGAGC